MRGSPAVIEVLNDALTFELTAINQYYIASKMAKNWAYHKLADAYFEESKGEMQHAVLDVRVALPSESQRGSPTRGQVVDRLRVTPALFSIRASYQNVPVCGLT